jgi:uncharacterized membrane protein
MHRSVADVLQDLQAEGLATDAAEAPARAALQQELQAHLPWFLRIAVGVGAWTATAFLLGFLIAVAQLDEPLARLIAGAALAAGGVYLRRVSDSEFRKHAGIAASLAGQGLILAAVYEFSDSPRITAMVLAVMCIVLIVIVHDHLHRFVSAVALAASLYVMMYDGDALLAFELVTIVLVVATAAVWRYRVTTRPVSLDEMLRPVGYALVVVLFAALMAGTITHFGNASLDPGRALRLGRTTTVAVMLLLAAFAWRINDEHRMSGTRTGFAAISGVLLLGLVTLSTPGIITGAAVLALAFDRRDRVLLGIGLVFLLVFGSVFYYSLHITLLQKALLLAGSGLLLLGIRQQMLRA